MNARMELTDELLHEALRVERLPIPIERRVAIRQAVATAPHRRWLHVPTFASPVQPAWLLVLLALLIAALAATAVGSRLLDQRALDTSDGSFELSPWDGNPTTLRFEYSLPDGLQFTTESVAGVTGFAEWEPALSYGYPSRTSPPAAAEARGVVVADITRATFHSNDAPPPARDAAAFLAKLDAIAVGSRGYDLSGVSQVELAGFPALAVDVSSSLSYPFLEMGESSHVVNLGGRSRILVADIEGRIVLIQIWAGSRSQPGTGEDLQRWLPLATEFVESFKLEAHGSE